VEGQRVDRACRLGSWAQAVGELESFQLEGYGDIEPAPARSAKGRYGRGKAVQRGKQCFVVELLPGLRGKRRGDERGLAVGNGVADGGVAVHAGRLSWRASGLRW